MHTYTYLEVHRHEGVGLGLNLRDTLDLLGLGEEDLLRAEGALSPLVEGLGIKADDDTDVHAATADHALDLLKALDLLDVGLDLVDELLESDKGGLVVVRRPLHAPLAGDGVKRHAFADFGHLSLATWV